MGVWRKFTCTLFPDHQQQKSTIAKCSRRAVLNGDGEIFFLVDHTSLSGGNKFIKCPQSKSLTEGKWNAILMVYFLSKKMEIIITYIAVRKYWQKVRMRKRCGIERKHEIWEIIRKMYIGIKGEEVMRVEELKNLDGGGGRRRRRGGGMPCGGFGVMVQPREGSEPRTTTMIGCCSPLYCSTTTVEHCNTTDHCLGIQNTVL